MKRINLILLGLALAIAALPLLLPATRGLAEPFRGTDAQAQALITQAHPDYRPWLSPLWEPPSGEIESLLFALQAALGAGLLGYYLGLRRGQAQRRGGQTPRRGGQTPRRGADAADVPD
jgi:cobalt/nickel transport protein